jgi:hypothetical protein
LAGMWLGRTAVGVVALGALSASSAWAASASVTVALAAGAATGILPPAVPAMTQAPTAPANAHGLVVVAFPGAADAAWPLAQAVYSNLRLRPDGLNDTQARVLCGDAPPRDSAASLRDIAETVASLRGDDAPTRVLLRELAHQVPARALLAVWMDASGRPASRVFLPESSTFDAAIYVPDAGRTVAWSGAARSLARIFAEPPTAAAPAPSLATHEATTSERGSASPHFFESPWFWGGIGAAAAAAAAIYLATRDSGSPTIHLEVQVPH